MQRANLISRFNTCPYSLWNLMSNKYRRFPSNNNSQEKETLHLLVFSPRIAFSSSGVKQSERALEFITRSVFSGWSCGVSELTPQTQPTFEYSKGC